MSYKILSTQMPLCLKTCHLTIVMAAATATTTRKNSKADENASFRNKRITGVSYRTPDNTKSSKFI